MKISKITKALSSVLKGSSLLISIIFSVLILIILILLIQLSQFNYNRNSVFSATLMMKNASIEQLKLSIGADISKVEAGVAKQLPTGWHAHLKTDIWGGYQIVHSQISSLRDSTIVTAYVGSVPPNNALIFKTIPEKIMISQFVAISGFTNLSSHIIRRTPKSSHNKPDNYGVSHNPNEIDGSWDDMIKNHLALVSVKCKDILEALESTDEHLVEQEYSNSFKNESMLFTVYDTLSDISLVGNIILYCPDILVISPTCNLDGIWIIADQIKVMADFKGAVHLTGTNRIELDSLVSLVYPSSIGISQDVGGVSSGIKIGSRCEIEGIIYGSEISQTSNLELDRTSTLEGEIFWPAKAELKGLVKGSCYVYSLYSASGSIYADNALHEVAISPIMRSPHYISPVIYSGSPFHKRKILKWLS